MDDCLWIPLSTGMKMVFHMDNIRVISFKVREGYQIEEVKNDKKTTKDKRRRWLQDLCGIDSWWNCFNEYPIIVCVGLIFGVQPARRASKLTPIEALR